MRLLSWNVNHRAGVREVPEWFVPAIEAERPDVLVCTEYVRGPQHIVLLKALRDVSLRDSDVTAPYHPGANCILIAAREPLLGGAAHPPPGSDSSVLSGFAHVILEKSAVHVIVFRMPDISEMSGGTDQECAWLADALGPCLEEPAIFIADFAAAPGDAQRRCAAQLDALGQRGWLLASPPGGARFSSSSGDDRRRHVAFASPLLSVSGAEYSWRFRETDPEATLARPGVPDQAMLLIDLKRAS